MIQEDNKEKKTEKEPEEGGTTDENNVSKDSAEKEQNQENPDQTDILKNEVGELKDKYIRLYSEFENVRRRTSKEKIDMIKAANEDVIVSLLPVVDDFERAEKAIAEGAAGKELEGFLLIQQKLRKILEQHGVKAIELAAGADFDPDYQEAITQIPAPEEKLKGKVVDVIEKGYQLNDKLIRYAKVVVGN